MNSIEWCINEVMDNVFQHSNSKYGYLMAQVHRESHIVTICVADNGIGIYNSLSNTKHKPRTHVDSISIAVKPGVTRFEDSGRGNGLFGLTRMVQISNGAQLRLTSGKGSLFVKQDEVNQFDNIPIIRIGRGSNGTVVDFQFKVDTEVNITEALGGHTPIFSELRNEQYITDSGNYTVKISEHSHGYGTRVAGELIRNKVINIYNETKNKIVLDFDGIGIISSSFADEFIAKLFVGFGFFAFQQIFELRNMNPTIQGLIDVAIAKRMQNQFQQK